MYVPDHFNESDSAVLHRLIVQNPLGALVTRGRSGLDANHIPFDLVSDQGKLGTLRTHIARANPLWQEVGVDDEVLVIFKAGDAYISPNWYPTMHEHHRQVPTWNYVVVHAHGRIRIRDDKRYVRGVVAKLTQTHEAQESQPWKIGDAPSDYLEQMIEAIVGVEVEITRLVGKRKLSQDEKTRDIQGAAEVLIARSSSVIGRAMLSIVRRKR